MQPFPFYWIYRPFKKSLYFRRMKFIRLNILFLTSLCCYLLSFTVVAQAYSHADSLKGTYGKSRSWWDLNHYALDVTFSPSDSSISGCNTISYEVIAVANQLQLDLMQPMQLDSVIQDGKACALQRDGNAFFVRLSSPQPIHAYKQLKAYFHGKPRVALNPPWDGGMVWTKDASGAPWISVACQGMAAGVWFPNKDHMKDEPDSAAMYFTVPSELMAVSNGRLRNIKVMPDGRYQYQWAVVNPINNYNIIPYIGKYAPIRDTFSGKAGILTLDYWVLREEVEQARSHFKQVKSMLRCFEDWFGPYPFYSDGYKLVQAPYLGMEHQSGIAYGNKYMQGYMGRDLSNTGWGLTWDFIIVHESGHEWFGNNISAADVADNWIHESFTAYSENLYVESLYSKKEGAAYVIGTRKAIQNDKPIIADYDVNRGGSNDVYYKGANMLHTIRQMVNNDSLWKSMLRGLNKDYYHKTVSSKDIESYMIRFLRLDLQSVFDQYLRSTQVPILEYKLQKGKLSYRWTNCVKKFNMPIRLSDGASETLVKATTKWQRMPWTGTSVIPNLNYYCAFKAVTE